MRTLAVGDIHGAHKALLQCLDRSGFQKDRDRLIVLGDVCDGYPQTAECVETLLAIKHCEMILGNHDLWTLDWAVSGRKPMTWTSQGGSQTIASYEDAPLPDAHLTFFKNARLWFQMENQVFVHGGLDPEVPLERQNTERLLWDRSLLESAWLRHNRGSHEPFGPYADIFVGHTPTQVFQSDVPLHFCNVWAMDTGAGWSSRLTIMDVATKEFWQSDPTAVLYEGCAARR